MDRPVPARGGCCGGKCKTRYMVAVLGSVGMGIAYGLKVNLSVAMVTMVNNTALHLHQPPEHASQSNRSKCGYSDAALNMTREDGPFEWNAEIQGWLLSSYFMGYLVAMYPGGRMAEIFSAKWVLFYAIAINVGATLLSPIMSKLHWGALLLMRILEGLGGGTTFPGGHALLSHWAPPLERSIMTTIMYAGTSLGTVVFFLVSGLIADGINWEAVFYIEGAFSAIWLVLWGIFVADSPKRQRFISQEERDMITNSIIAESGIRLHRPPMPWKAIYTSPAFLAIQVAHVCSNWGWYLLLIELPNYLKHVLGFTIGDNTMYTSIPFFTNWVFTMILGRILDTLRKKRKITTTVARKIATLIASVIPMLCLIVLCVIECEREVAVAMMSIAVTSMGGMFCGFLTNHIDIAPHFAGSLIGLTNTPATLPGILVPIVVGILTHRDPTIESWRKVFYMTISLFVLEIVVYTIWGSGEVQPWNNPQHTL